MDWRAMQPPIKAASPRRPAMSRFHWRGIGADGRRRRGTLVALDARSALERIRRDRIVAVELIEVRARWSPRVRHADLTRATRHLAMLLRSGLSLQPALALVAQHAGMPLKPLFETVLRDITEGSTLSRALQRHDRVFPAAYWRLVELAEHTGSLDTILAQLADTRDRVAAQRARLRNALWYPTLILALALGLCALLLAWVVPTFERVFAGFGSQLPRPTRIVVALSRQLLTHGPAMVAAGGLGIACGMLAWQRSPRFRLHLHALLLRAPLVGPIVQRVAIARWSHALGQVLDAGIALADGFDAVDGISGNAAMDAATCDIAARVRVGASLADAMRASTCFPPDVVATIALAEQAGTLGTTLADIGAWNDRLVAERIGLLAQLAEPLIIVGPGALIAALVVAMYLPIIEMGNIM